MANNQSSALSGSLGVNLRPLLLLLGIAAAVAAGVALVLWWRGPNWSPLFGSLSDGDAGAVVQALQGSGIQYKLEDGSGAILVPAEKVREARLKLASQGLPQGKSGGFDLMSKDPGFGVSEFMENARYQYALEKELEGTIASLQEVRAARVHLAMPQQSAFVHDQRPASASVLLQLRAGHRLEPEQVSAIVHLVASSIPQLDSDQVTVVDQEGHLLSSPKNGDAVIDSQQFEAAHRIEDTYTDRIEQLIAPMVGAGRVHAQVTVDLDNDASEQAQEQYKPDGSVVRSEQTSEQLSHDAAGNGGVPGALTNQPPAGGVAVPVAKPPPAPATPSSNGGSAAAAAAAAATAAPPAGATAEPANSSKQSTRNYEIDRTLSYSHQPAGRIKRVSVAVLLDNLRKVGEGGKVTQQPLSAAQLDDVTKLVKNAVGFDSTRGDSVSVVNAPFLEEAVETLTPVTTPLWQQPWLRDVIRLVLGAALLLVLTLGVLRPLFRSLAVHALAPPPALSALDGPGGAERGPGAQGPQLAYEQQIVQARSLVSQDPKRVAQVVKTWVSES
jgi:flagellar M-ring protein FliF